MGAVVNKRGTGAVGGRVALLTRRSATRRPVAHAKLWVLKQDVGGLGVSLATVLMKVPHAGVVTRAGGSVAPIHCYGRERPLCSCSRPCPWACAAPRVTATHVSSCGSFSSTRTAITFALPVTVLRAEKEEGSCVMTQAPSSKMLEVQKPKLSNLLGIFRLLPVLCENHLSSCDQAVKNFGPRHPRVSHR